MTINKNRLVSKVNRRGFSTRVPWQLVLVDATDDFVGDVCWRW